MRAAPGGMCRGGSQVSAQALIPGWTRWERQGAEWQGVRKPTVMMDGAGARELGGGWERWWVVYWVRR